VTGDILDHGGGPAPLDDAVALLARLESKDPALAVLGNHDTGCFAAGDAADERAASRMRGALAEAGVALLSNEARVIEQEGARLAVAGYGDLWSGLFRGGEARAPDGACTVALSHNPDTAPELARRGCNLVLSGHTHGGQVTLPLFGPPYVPVRTPYVHGPYRVGPAKLYVNAGLGCSRRIRFGARPELTLLTLRARPA
jgi:predicted MPP superfamily phosphohydrolase